MAHEYLELVCQLWESWEPDAVVRDRDTGTYVDHSKVHTTDFEGKYYRSRGPLNTVRAPQGRPVLCQAGASPKGRDFAAKYADTIIAYGGSTAEMKSFRDDVRARMATHGRKPDTCKVMFIVQPILGDTDEEADAKRRRWREDPLNIEAKLAGISSITEVDFAPYDWDEVPPQDLTTNGERNSLDTFLQKGSGRTLRQLVTDGFGDGGELVGTPDSVAEQMDAMMEEVGGDGFLITSPIRRLSRRYVTEITDGLIPALQRRGVVRTAYTYEQFRDNLLDF
jgi:alkanesulfonate monooxygenase SsuD/methylene tetrahydromethanopterin reductase-like flavin-dependent oxidoreductase (luciferase family)